jgi:hypothetical protein
MGVQILVIVPDCFIYLKLENCCGNIKKIPSGIESFSQMVCQRSG